MILIKIHDYFMSIYNQKELYNESRSNKDKISNDLWPTIQPLLIIELFFNGLTFSNVEYGHGVLCLNQLLTFETFSKVNANLQCKQNKLKHLCFTSSIMFASRIIKQKKKHSEDKIKSFQVLYNHPLIFASLLGTMYISTVDSAVEYRATDSPF